MSTASGASSRAGVEVDVEAGDASTYDNMGKTKAAALAAASPASSTSGSSQGLRILMKDLTYTVPSNTKKGEVAYLLRDVNAFLEPGQMTALMGPSGSGKTTLLDLLAGRKTVGKTTGHLSFGGVSPTKAFLRRYTGYVEQFDTLLGDLTVREMLTYTAELKRPTSEPLKDKRHAVDVLLQRLALAPCGDVRIGDPLTKGISGGQAKRTNIGIALISNPRVLFLDEPTSGLDSYTANEVMKVVRGLTSDGTTIAATIHSPTAATFALFDRVMLLVRGHLVYFGPQGLPALEFAASEWGPAAAGTASELLALHRAASTAAPLAIEAAGTSTTGAAGDDDNKAKQQKPAASSSSLAALAFNDAEVLVEAVTEADHRGEAAALAAAYAKSRLAQDNARQIEMYIAESAHGRGGLGGAKSSGLCRVATALGVSKCNSSGKVTGTSKAADVELGAADAASGGGEQSQPQQLLRQRTSSPFAAAASSGALSVSEQVAKELATRSETVTPWYWALWTLLKYRTSKNYCNPGWLGPRIGDKLLISLIILTLYLGIGDNFAPDNLINIQSSLFMWALLPAFGAASYVPAIVLERRLFVRERADGLYRVFTYLAAKLVEELILSVIITLIFSSYVFYGVQLKGAWVVFWLVYFIDLSVGIVLAYLVAALSPNMDVANAALPGFVVTLLFFAGQLMTVDSIPPWWQWYSRIDPLRYAWGALMLNQFEDNDVIFAGDQTILQYYGLAGEDKWAYIGYLSLFWIVFAVLALLALTYVRHQKR
ncbi:hypothetical protein HYH02_008009 [Chlamydomonas schloesseri]|uniref:ABC transporter domain-containing protein n=1 Tax=Chlamydomonas schloesseri TaxID=2026947 RepID=A0A835WG74_9CHLO|nr:hypothetical protein HYH02_008009 [Chlamydomonas schloesseri]|eukprot:KAG2446852.1 hypothetical protein HYH02_008009 [Chlamydomonas schloesseri]